MFTALSINVLITRSVGVFPQFGAARFQIGGSYAWLASHGLEARGLIEGIQRSLDPERGLNGGYLWP